MVFNYIQADVHTGKQPAKLTQKNKNKKQLEHDTGGPLFDLSACKA